MQFPQLLFSPANAIKRKRENSGKETPEIRAARAPFAKSVMKSNNFQM